MKNRLKLLPFVFFGSFFIGESSADDNYVSLNIDYGISEEGVRFRTPGEVALSWQGIHNQLYENCLIQAQEKETYSCVETVFHSLRADESARMINGEYERYLLDTTVINHNVFRNPETGDIESESQTSVGDVVVISQNRSCPDGLNGRYFNVSATSLNRYCILSDKSIDNQFSADNSINIFSRTKYELATDFYGRGWFDVARFYRNQNSGWSFDDTYSLIDLYNVELGEPVEVDLKRFTLLQTRYDENTSSDLFDTVTTVVSKPFEYVVPNDEGRKVLIADQYGITYSFIGGPTVFRSSIDSSVLTYTPAIGEELETWHLVDSSGTQRFFNSSGDVTEIRYLTDHITYYQYDEDNRMIKKENKFGDYITYEYDASGNVIQVTVMPENIVFDYTYETIETGTYPDRLVEVKQDQVVTLKYQYDDLDYPLAMTSVTDGNDIPLAHWDYNANGEAVLTSPDNVDFFSVNYARGVRAPIIAGGFERYIGNGAKVTNPSGRTTSHAVARIAGYDRVYARVFRSADGSLDATEFFTYDSKGNLNTETGLNGDVTFKIYDENNFLVELRTGYRWSGEIARYGLLDYPRRYLVGRNIESDRYCWNTETGVLTSFIGGGVVYTFVYSELGQVINTIEEPVNSTNNKCH